MGVLLSKHVPCVPTPVQEKFLSDDILKVWLGKAGSGKSTAMAMAALQHIDNPSYEGIVFGNATANVLRRWLEPFMHEGKVRLNYYYRLYQFFGGGSLELRESYHRDILQGRRFHFIGIDDANFGVLSDIGTLMSRIGKSKELEVIRLRITIHDFLGDALICEENCYNKVR